MAVRHEQTIAIIRDLVSTGRIGSLREIVHPLLSDPVVTTLAIDEQALIRALLARGEVVCSRQTEMALNVLAEFRQEASRTNLSHSTRAELALSLGLAQSLPSEPTFHPGRAFAFFDEAAQSLRNNPVENAWLRLGRARVFLGIGQRKLAAQLIERTSHTVSIVQSATLTRWYEELLLSGRFSGTKGNGAASELIDPVVAESPPMRSLIRQFNRLERPRHPILLTGEAGVGKRFLAKVLLDRLAPAADTLNLNCDTEGSKLEDHLASWEQGVVALRIENLEKLDRASQMRLASFLSACDSTSPLNPIVATSGKDMDELLRDDSVDSDLASSFGILRFHVPSLRERREDIPLLARHFARDSYSGDEASLILSSAALEALTHYDWPGNVTELRDEMQELLNRFENEPIPVVRKQDLRKETTGSNPLSRALSVQAIEELLRPGHDLDEVLASTEKAFIERVLVTTDGQITAASEMLGLSRQGLYKKIKRLGIDPHRLLDSTPVGSDVVPRHSFG